MNLANKITMSRVVLSIVIMIVLFSTKFNPIRLLSSTYNMNQLEESIGKIKIGDFIDYEINGYSNWQVVSIDKENNTLDVVSRENVEDITLETKDEVDCTNVSKLYYADKYIKVYYI